MIAALRQLLFDPDAFFARRDDLPSGPVGLAVAFGVSTLVTTVLGLALFGIAGQLTGTVTVDNPAHAPEWACDGGSGAEFTPTGCDAPATIERRLGDIFWEAASDQLVPLLVGLVVVWAGLSVALWVAATLAGGRGSLGETAGVAASGMVPTVATAAVAGGLLVWFATGADLSASDPQQVLATFRALTTGLRGLALTGVQLLGAAWQAYVWAYGLVHTHDLPTDRAGVAAGAVALLLAAGTLL